MAKFKKIKTPIEGLYIIESSIFEDSRGFFMESFNQREFIDLGLKMNFVQDNYCRSKKGALRGLHFQTEHPQGKLLQVIKGVVYDVAVDLRKDSATYGQYYGIILSSGNQKMLYIPEKFAHGVLTLSEEAEFLYKTGDYYYPEFATGLIWNDQDINIDWPLDEYSIKEENLLLSDRDKNLPTLKEYNMNNKK
ncbi:MAG: dTDP-4-dehydrorhamnose 3,5-epimerase [bacterium]